MTGMNIERRADGWPVISKDNFIRSAPAWSQAFADHTNAAIVSAGGIDTIGVDADQRLIFTFLDGTTHQTDPLPTALRPGQAPFTTIATTDALDTLTGPGFYSVRTSGGTPTNSWGLLLVWPSSTSVTLQQWVPNTNPGQIWQRHRTNTSWSSWAALGTTEWAPTVTQGSTWRLENTNGRATLGAYQLDGRVRSIAGARAAGQYQVATLNNNRPNRDHLGTWAEVGPSGNCGVAGIGSDGNIWLKCPDGFPNRGTAIIQLNWTN